MEKRSSDKKKYVNIDEYAFLDYARVVAIFAVIIMHIMINIIRDFNFSSDIFYKYISYNKFADYLFFILSGYSFTKYKTSITVSKTLNLVLKRYIGLTLFAIPYNFVEHLWSSNLLYSNSMIYDAIIGGLRGFTWDHLWFMYNLLLVYLLMPFLLLIYKNKNKFLLLIFTLALFVLCFFGISINIKIPIPLLSMMPFNVVLLSVTCGAFLYKYNFFEKINKWVFILIIIFMTITWFKVPTIFNYINSEFFIIILSIMIFISFNKMLNNKSKLFSMVSSHNYIIYLIHVLFLHVITKVLKINPYNYFGMIGIIVFAFLIYFLSLGSAIIIETIPCIGNLYKKK